MGSAIDCRKKLLRICCNMPRIQYCVSSTFGLGFVCFVRSIGIHGVKKPLRNLEVSRSLFSYPSDIPLVTGSRLIS